MKRKTLSNLLDVEMTKLYPYPFNTMEKTVIMRAVKSYLFDQTSRLTKEKTEIGDGANKDYFAYAKEEIGRITVLIDEEISAIDAVQNRGTEQ
jgi:hypothetical protein